MKPHLPLEFFRGDKPLVELYVEPAGFSGRCTRVSVPLCVVPSSTGLPSKRCPGVRFLSRVDREFGIFQHVAPTMRLLFEFPHETGLIRRFAGNVGNPLQTKHGNRPSCRDQERRKASVEVVPGTSVSPLVRSVYRGTFGVASRVPSTVLHFKTECETSLEML